MPFLNLALAVVWFTLAVVFLTWSRWMGSEPPTIYNTGIPWSWFFLLMTVYNLLRFWGQRSAQKRREAWAQQQARRAQERSAPSPAAPDPMFDFSSPQTPPKAPPESKGD